MQLAIAAAEGGKDDIFNLSAAVVADRGYALVNLIGYVLYGSSVLPAGVLCSLDSALLISQCLLPFIWHYTRHSSKCFWVSCCCRCMTSLLS